MITVAFVARVPGCANSELRTQREKEAMARAVLVFGNSFNITDTVCWGPETRFRGMRKGLVLWMLF